MIGPFTYTGIPNKIVFGAGKRKLIASELHETGANRALILCTPGQQNKANEIAEHLGSAVADIFTGAAMHTPVNVTENALNVFREAGANAVIAVGGGSTIGLGKAIAYRNDTPQIAIPITYAGSEVTPIFGQTDNGVKTTVRDTSIQPDVVIYDPELSTGLPVSISVTSGLNAMAHAIEALYAKDRNPIASLMAVEGIRAMKAALPVIARSPDDINARSNALYGACLCGTVLGNVGMALHHKLCHTLGGSFDLDHAQTHAVLLPHTIAYNEKVSCDELRPAAQLFDSSLSFGLWALAKELGAPLSLKQIGMAESDLDKAAEFAVKNPYWNPRPIERDAIRALLQHAFDGTQPR